MFFVLFSYFVLFGVVVLVLFSCFFVAGSVFLGFAHGKGRRVGPMLTAYILDIQHLTGWWQLKYLLFSPTSWGR